VPHEVAHSCGAEQNDGKIKPSIPAIERHPPRCMIQGVSQDVKPYLVAIHALAHFFGPVGAEGRGGGEGCLGPGPAPGLAAALVAGWRTPCARRSNCGCRTPWPSIRFFLSVTVIVSMWVRHAEMRGIGSRWRAIQCRHSTLKDCTGIFAPVKASICLPTKGYCK
jgi:hypothetical protein